MLARLVLVLTVLIGMRADASGGLDVRTTCTADVARDPAHLRTLRGELARALADLHAPAGHTLDVSLVTLATTAHGTELEVRAELRAILSDERGRIRWSSAARATARGGLRDRTLLQRDAVGAAARRLAEVVRARCCSS